jgi:hypothetical protein
MVARPLGPGDHRRYPNYKRMRTQRNIALMLTVTGFAWFAFVGVMYVCNQMRMHAIATELYMPERVFYTLSDPLEPMDRFQGDERLLVVGKGDTNYILASIVRNTAFSDFRGQWKVDYCLGGDPDFENGRLIVWEPFDTFPTDQDVANFRQLASSKRFVVWDTPDGTVPEDGG